MASNLLECHIWDRAKWQRVRDSFKVPKGVGKQPIGGVLDKYHQARRTAMLKKVPELNAKLRADLKAYQLALDTEAKKMKPADKAKRDGYVKFSDRISDELLNDIKDYDNKINAAVAAVTKYAASYQAVGTALDVMVREVKKTGQPSAGWHPQNLKSLQQSLIGLSGALQAGVNYSKQLDAGTAKQLMTFTKTIVQRKADPNTYNEVFKLFKKLPQRLEVGALP